MTYEVYEVEGGYGYRILTTEGVIVIDQAFDPELPGLQPFTEEGAAAAAIVYLAIEPPAPVDIPQPLSKTEQLEQENAFIALELMQTKIQLESTEVEMANLVLMLVERNVI